MHAPRALIPAALILAIGITGGGFLAGRGLVASRALDLVVTVKYLSETEVPADVFVSTIQYYLAD